MPHAAYPDQQDCERLIRSLGIFDADALDAAILDLDLETLAAAASRQWEDETGWHPFLADVSEDSEDEERFFDPGGPNWRPQLVGGGYGLDLEDGIVTLTSVNTGWSEDNDGTALTIPNDVRLYPYNAVQKNRPSTMLQFFVPIWGLRHSIRVVGRFGYASTVPDDAWLAIARMGAGMALPEIATNVTEGGWTFTEAGVTEKPMDGFLLGEGTVGGAWVKQWKATSLRYKRLVL